ncbi:hypothetical protein MAY81_29645, partial [Escherichia coli]
FFTSGEHDIPKNPGEKASKIKGQYSRPPACLLYCTKFTGTKKPLSGGFKLCGEVTTLNSIFDFLRL